jgi:hypothetical protein
MSKNYTLVDDLIRSPIGSTAIPISQTLELKTNVMIEKNMKLLDINGKKISFRSECFVKPKNKNSSFNITIVNQNELDNGNIKFETITNNSFSRRVTYESEDGEHLNHYIAIKKLSTDTKDEPIDCDVIIRLTELETKINNKNDNENDIENDNKNTELNQQLFNLSNSSEYKLHNNENEKLDNNENNNENIYENVNQTNIITKTKNYATLYRNIAIGCLLIFIIIMFTKKR